MSKSSVLLLVTQHRLAYSKCPIFWMWKGMNDSRGHYQAQWYSCLVWMLATSWGGISEYYIVNPLKASSNWPNGEGESNTCDLASWDGKTAKNTSWIEYWQFRCHFRKDCAAQLEAPCLSVALHYWLTVGTHLATPSCSNKIKFKNNMTSGRTVQSAGNLVCG